MTPSYNFRRGLTLYDGVNGGGTFHALRGKFHRATVVELSTLSVESSTGQRWWNFPRSLWKVPPPLTPSRGVGRDRGRHEGHLFPRRSLREPHTKTKAGAVERQLSNQHNTTRQTHISNASAQQNTPRSALGGPGGSRLLGEAAEGCHRGGAPRVPLPQGASARERRWPCQRGK